MIYSVSTNKDNISKLYVAGRLEWTSEPPTQEGWYWHCDTDGLREVYNVVYMHGVFGVFFMDEDFYPCKDEGGFWLGPLPEPESPTTDS